MKSVSKPAFEISGTLSEGQRDSMRCDGFLPSGSV